jgi:hypothetical protein
MALANGRGPASTLGNWGETPCRASQRASPQHPGVRGVAWLLLSSFARAIFPARLAFNQPACAAPVVYSYLIFGVPRPINGLFQRRMLLAETRGGRRPVFVWPCGRVDVSPVISAFCTISHVGASSPIALGTQIACTFDVFRSPIANRRACARTGPSVDSRSPD